MITILYVFECLIKEVLWKLCNESEKSYCISGSENMNQLLSWANLGILVFFEAIDK